MIISDVFTIGNAHSKGFEQHRKGSIPFVTNGFRDNGIIGFVEPLKGEKVINSAAICISAFCEATVQKPPFLPRGNGGSGLLVLEPKKSMSEEELYYFAAQINKQAWRFSFGRMVIGERIANIVLRPFNGISLKTKIDDLVPQMSKRMPIAITQFKGIPIHEICNIDRKYAPYMNQLDTSNGITPYVTTTEMDNGISLRCKAKPNFQKNSITVSLDGLCGTTFYQFEDYVAGEKTAVITLKSKPDPFLLLYIALLIRMKAWRFNYGCKLSIGRLNNIDLVFPVNKNGEIDTKAIERIVRNSYGWEIIETLLPL